MPAVGLASDINHWKGKGNRRGQLLRALGPLFICTPPWVAVATDVCVLISNICCQLYFVGLIERCGKMSYSTITPYSHSESDVQSSRWLTASTGGSPGSAGQILSGQIRTARTFSLNRAKIFKGRPRRYSSYKTIIMKLTTQPS